MKNNDDVGNGAKICKKINLIDKTDDFAADCIYLAGGYSSYDCGCPAWGSIREEDCLYIGDAAGDLLIKYKDGTADKIPLIIGYTVWFKNLWRHGPAPFKGVDAEEHMSSLLKQILHVEGAFEGNDEVFLKIKIRQKPVSEAVTIANGEKPGMPFFSEGYLLKEDNDAVIKNSAFFINHTIDSTNPEPAYEILDEIRKRLYTFEDDFTNVMPFHYSEEYNRPKIAFSGDALANILTRVYHDNIEDMLAKMESDGMINESTPKAPTWFYDGFGTWLPERGSYYGAMYSRNHRGIISLSYLGFLPEVQKTVAYCNKKLMYFKENHLEIAEKQIPGHWGVLTSDPLHYSNILTNYGWPTKYTKERFGENYRNFGNSEPDGHGLTMIAIANVWENSGSPAEWILENWQYLSEAVDYIGWAMKNTDISFNEKGLMYGESEGGMMNFTMYNNVPCYLGIRMYIAMAKAAGMTEKAAEWTTLADNMEKAIFDGFEADGKWDLSKTGFFHDPSLAVYSDVLGYDASDIPAKWFSLSENTFYDDLNKYIGDTYLGVRGLGYDHNLITQTALMLDKTKAYGEFVRNLAKLCCSPRLPYPFIIPECASYSKKHGLYRRLGDVGNYAQQSESIRTILMVAGTSKIKGDTAKIIPRLPENWTVKVTSLTIPGSAGKISYTTAYPNNNKQEISFTVNNKGNINTIRFRTGPFTSDTITINGKPASAFKAGDAYWAWVVFDNIEEDKEYSAIVCI